MHPFKCLKQINMEVWALQQQRGALSKQELHRRSLDIAFDISAYMNRQCFVLEYIWKSQRMAWAAKSLRRVFPECDDAITCILQWLHREDGERDAIQAVICELVRDQHPVGFQELMLLTAPHRELAALV